RDWSSDVCSSDLIWKEHVHEVLRHLLHAPQRAGRERATIRCKHRLCEVILVEAEAVISEALLCMRTVCQHLFLQLPLEMLEAAGNPRAAAMTVEEQPSDDERRGLADEMSIRMAADR